MVQKFSVHFQSIGQQWKYCTNHFFRALLSRDLSFFCSILFSCSDLIRPYDRRNKGLPIHQYFLEWRKGTKIQNCKKKWWICGVPVWRVASQHQRITLLSMSPRLVGIGKLNSQHNSLNTKGSYDTSWFTDLMVHCTPVND